MKTSILPLAAALLLLGAGCTQQEIREFEEGTWLVGGYGDFDFNSVDGIESLRKSKTTNHVSVATKHATIGGWGGTFLTPNILAGLSVQGDYNNTKLRFNSQPRQIYDTTGLTFAGLGRYYFFPDGRTRPYVEGKVGGTRVSAPNTSLLTGDKGASDWGLFWRAAAGVSQFLSQDVFVDGYVSYGQVIGLDLANNSFSPGSTLDVDYDSFRVGFGLGYRFGGRDTRLFK